MNEEIQNLENFTNPEAERIIREEIVRTMKDEIAEIHKIYTQLKRDSSIDHDGFKELSFDQFINLYREKKKIFSMLDDRKTIDFGVSVKTVTLDDTHEVEKDEK